MNRNRATVLMLVTAGLIAGITQIAKADEWDQKTIFTFSAPVEIPVVIPANGAEPGAAEPIGFQNESDTC
jgi:hypothetical protein